MPPWECSEQIVWVETADGIRHDGAVIRPCEQPAALLPVVWVHGFGSHFADPLPIRLGRRLAERGHVFVTGNNRGHHILFALGSRQGKVVPGGAWAEKFSDAPLDIAAWIDFTCALGFPRVVLIGHSYGGAKVIHFQATRQDERVAGAVSASMPVRTGGGLADIPDTTALAERMVAEGRGDELLPYGMLGPGFATRTAAAYLNYVRDPPDVFGAAHADPPIARVRCPVLAIYGAQEGKHDVAVDFDLIRRNARTAARIDTALIEGDHGYTGHEAAAADVIADWLAALY